MMEMKGKAIEKLMSVLDEVLGEDVSGRVKKALSSAPEAKEGPEMEESEDEGMPPSETGEMMGKELASGGSGVLALPEIEEEDESGSEEGSKPKGVGIEVQDVKVAAMPRPGLMKKMRGKA